MVTQGLINESYTCINAIGLSKSFESNSIKTFPNPASNFVTIDLGNINLIDISIINTHGQVVWQSNESSLEIDIEKLNAGINFVKGENVTSKFTGKFIKE